MNVRIHSHIHSQGTDQLRQLEPVMRNARSKTMSWVFLILAILFEVSGTTAMKLSNGFEHPLPSVAVFVCYAISIGLLTMAVRSIDISVAYAIWSALGMTLITIIGIAWFKEPATFAKLVSIAVITLGVVGLNFSERLGGG